jgi:hypothetical protein
MNPMAFAMTGMGFALWLNGCYLLGLGTTPKAGSAAPAKTVGVAGSLAGFIGLMFAAIWFVVGEPFGGREAARLHALFSGITGMYGLLWMGVFAAQVFDLDWRPIANVFLLAALIQAVEIVAMFRLFGTASPHIWFTNAAFAVYVVWLVAYARTIYGRLTPRATGWWSVVALAGTLYLLFFGGGLFRHP